MFLHDTRNLTVASLSDSLNCNFWCLQIPDIHLGRKLHGTGTRALLLCMIPPQPSVEWRLSTNLMEVYQDSDYPKSISFLGYFPACISNYGGVMELMNLLCSKWLSQ